MLQAAAMDRGDDEHLRLALAATARGDRKAFADLYRLASPTLMAVALRVLARRDAAEDVLQEAFLAIWDKAGQYQAERGAPLGWMAMVVRHRAIDRVRRERRRGEDVFASPDEAGDVPSMTERADSSAHDVLACLGRLAPEPRRAIWLALRHGFTHEEVAARMDRPLGTVKSWIRRGVIDLKECLDR
ncbi:sigma-70 family RNA polymerase sigma factor [Reyranella sp. CPCC 100927]|uniref:sigma-70 family RNA polymerase sigma factor n=1 Tax=Reyranella sp. CPCC 100927 TaxID=2599616 RepID=UPI0011B6CE32|nr:sigma-70 family RNA polymerase sigma factor [Reyranella sp. CPCC 100927]TWT12798.1 sigma-70 family RNA polymerase sigma factor [Reyranella sp. CPCC 100927]